MIIINQRYINTIGIWSNLDDVVIDYDSDYFFVKSFVNEDGSVITGVFVR